MSPDIWIDDEVFEVIKNWAIPFEDRQPNDVLRRLLLAGEADADVAAQLPPTRREQPAASEPRASRSANSRKRGDPTAKRKATKRTRVPSSALMPETNYRLPILRALSDAGGRMATSEAVAAVGEIVRDQLKPADLDLKGSKPRWEQRIQFTRLRLIEDGLMKKDSPRGMWEISGEGEQLVRHSIKMEAVDAVRAKREAAPA